MALNDLLNSQHVGRFALDTIGELWQRTLRVLDDTKVIDHSISNFYFANIFISGIFGVSSDEVGSSFEQVYYPHVFIRRFSRYRIANRRASIDRFWFEE